VFGGGNDDGRVAASKCAVHEVRDLVQQGGIVRVELDEVMTQLFSIGPVVGS